ncbi:hypothetical protein OA101_01280 [Alphaproteobacteria bacterium]|jgi:hypothetical protein|nr:hypothetical protein [Alphaproteobacteria bacterium]
MKWGAINRLGYLNRDWFETNNRGRNGIPMQTEFRSGRELSATDTLTIRPNITGN